MTQEELLELLHKQMGDKLDQASIKEQPQADLLEAGLDSMGVFFLLDDLAQKGYQLEFTDFIAQPTLAYLMEATQGES
ncbi:phosphopantetheine-binding protein [Rothia sp. CCM 9417]|uniref:phosphopantetheine-binding protein n=1 Tax=Rothia sp. CCM 9417 TaxID=3402657 RepID=UPI003AD8335B